MSVSVFETVLDVHNSVRLSSEISKSPALVFWGRGSASCFAHKTSRPLRISFLLIGAGKLKPEKGLLLQD